MRSYLPDWFQESMEELKPLLQQRNDAYNKWLAAKRKADSSRFKEAKNVARKAIRNAKNSWFQRKAEEGRKGVFWWEESVEVHKEHAAWM